MPDLFLHSTLSGEREIFVPLDPMHIRMYVCGPTVYDYAHIGNARPVVVFDVLYRLLKKLYPTSKVTYVRNITDIDDKIMDVSKKTGKPISEITQRTAQAYFDDMSALNALMPDIQPRATEFIAQMIAMIQALIEKGHAYEAEGHVLFDVPSMSNYGSLSKLDQEQLIAGARVDVAPYKKDQSDFVLWKPSADDQPGWLSPWGRGRPGWHIECSAMSLATLGAQFDIHAGGQDLIFPHHENEIAQSCCANGTSFMAKYWLHNGYLVFDGEKMSKSLGNIKVVHDLLKEWPGEVIRFALLSAQYRQPLDFSGALLESSKNALDRLYRALDGEIHSNLSSIELDDRFISALCHDLNTPQAISVLFELASEIYKEEDAKKAKDLRSVLKVSAELIGLCQGTVSDWFAAKKAVAKTKLSEADIEALMAERKQARADKNFKRSDEIRDELKAQGVAIEDSASGVRWYYL